MIGHGKNLSHCLIILIYIIIIYTYNETRAFEIGRFDSFSVSLSPFFKITCNTYSLGINETLRHDETGGCLIFQNKTPNDIIVLQLNETMRQGFGVSETSVLLVNPGVYS